MLLLFLAQAVLSACGGGGGGGGGKQGRDYLIGRPDSTNDSGDVTKVVDDFIIDLRDVTDPTTGAVSKSKTADASRFANADIIHNFRTGDTITVKIDTGRYTGTIHVDDRFNIIGAAGSEVHKRDAIIFEATTNRVIAVVSDVGDLDWTTVDFKWRLSSAGSDVDSTDIATSNILEAHLPDYVTDGSGSARQYLTGTAATNDRFEVDGDASASLEDADVVFGFEAANDTINISATTSLRYDSRFDLDGDGHRDTILFGGNSSAYVILDNYVLGNGAALTSQLRFNDVPVTQNPVVSEFVASDGTAEGRNTLVGNAFPNDFRIDGTAEAGFALADLIHGFFQTSDRIALPSTVSGQIKYDKDSDWNGDGTKDTIIYVTEGGVDKTLAILNDVSVVLLATDFTGGTNITVIEEDLPILPDIA